MFRPDIVVSGMSGRFPASDSIEEFKQNLYSGVDMVTCDSSRWPIGLWGLPPCSGKVKSFDKFDSKFFGCTPKEVEYIDPQERKLLEATYEAIVDAGVDPKSLKDSNTGIFQGSCFIEYHKDFKDASAKSKYIPNQVTTLARHFDLKGPLMHVDTACGSSFCALNEAFRALKNGMCDQAIVTGSNTVFQPIFSYEMLDLHMISKDGKSKCMDSSADGYARSEAVVVVYLQKKSAAKRIYATILNSKTSADGWKAEGVTFPSQEAQAKLLRETYREIGLNPLDFEYIEAHTTGTTAGDPAELNAIYDVLCEGRTDSLLVGGIKSCIGHSEGASGLCALVKAILVLQNKKIPPNLHLKHPNLNIKGLVDGKMTPVTKVTPFHGNTIPVNCFGFGGANVHVVIQSCDRRLTADSYRLVENSFPRLVHVCGRTRESVDYILDHVVSSGSTMTREFLSLLNDFSKSRPQDGMSFRGSLIIDNHRGQASADGGYDYIRNVTPQACQKKKKLCLYFAGDHFHKFAVNLMRIPVCAKSVKQLNDTIKVTGFDLLESMQKEGTNRSREEAVAINTAIQISLVDLIKTLDIRVDCFAGHGVGEFGCAYLDGAITAEQALQAALVSVAFYQDHDNLKAELNKIFLNPIVRSSGWTTPGSSLASGDYFAEQIWSHQQNAFTVVPCRDEEDVFVLEVGPWGLKPANCDASSSDNSCLNTLRAISLMYTHGLNPAIEKMYPEVAYPIPTCVPSLSPLIKWDHSQTWSLSSRLIELDSYDNAVLARIIPFHFDKREHPEDNFLFDHKIDGRVLFPATGYLAMAWFALSKLKNRHLLECPIKFSEVYFERASVLVNSKPTTFTVRMNEDTGIFEVRDGDIVFVSGRMETSTEKTNHVAQVANKCPILSSIDVYKELRVRGYDYGPFFRGIHSAKCDGTEASIVWRDVVPKNVKDTMSFTNDDEINMMWLRSWIMFVDSLIQLTLLDEENTGRALFVPTKLEFLECYPRALAKALDQYSTISDPLTLSHSKLAPCAYNRHDGVIQTKGLILKGLKTSLLKRNQQIVRTKKFEFVPFNESTAFDTLSQQRAVEKYFFNCLQVARLVANPTGSSTTSITVDENDRKHSLLRLLIARSRGGKMDFDLSEDLIVGRYQEEFYYQDRFLKPFFDLVTYNTIFSPKHTSLEVLEVTSNNFTLRKNFSNLMEESLFSDQTTISYSLLNTGDQLPLNEPIPSDVQKVVNWNITNEAMIPNSHLIIYKDFSSENMDEKPRLFRALFNATKEGGFLMVVLREECRSGDLKNVLNYMGVELPVNATSAELYTIAKSVGYRLIGTKALLEGIIPLKVALFRKQRLYFEPEQQIIIEVGLSNYDEWLEELKYHIEADNDDRRIWLIPKRDESLIGKASISGLIGFVKSLRLEDGGHRLRCLLDWTNSSGPVDFCQDKYRQTLQNDLVFNVMHEERVGWGTYEHLFMSDFQTKESVRESKHLYLKSLKPGDLSSLVWSQNNFSEDISNNLVNIFYAPLNFKDIMYASGKLALDSVHDIDPHIAQDSLLGMEFAGEDTNGNRVMGVLPYKALATTVAIDDNSFLLPVPEGWTLEEAATVPVVYSTAFYGLVVRGQLRAGETVLIHCGAGGVGLAAINICLGKGCTVYTSVGTEDKVDFLLREFPQLCRAHIFNSRSTCFEEDILRVTDGRGVDVVLNSLSGDKFQASLRCVAQCGRFIEIGKVDLLKDSSLYTWQLGGNKTMHGVYPESFFRFNTKKNFYWPKRMSDERSRLKQLIMQGVEDGIVRPLPRTLFGMNQVEDAFRYMSTGKHIGKVVISMRERGTQEERDVMLSPETIATTTIFCPSKSYIVVGGLGGFGLEVVQWMAEKGARNVVVNSRRGIRGPYQKYCIDRLEKDGVSVIISQADSTTETGIRKLIAIASEMGQLGGVFNTAVVFNDMLFGDQTTHTFDMVCAPKVRATLFLDKITRKMCPSLEYFVAFSSISAGRGNPGQTSYNFANSIIDGICAQRRHDGLHGLSIQWGVIGDVGYVAEMANSNGTVILGLTSQRMHSCLTHLDKFMQSEEAVVCCYVKAEKDSSEEISDTTDILKLVSRILGLKDINSVDHGTSLCSLGIDSLMAVEIQQIIERVQGTQVPLKRVKELTIGQFIEVNLV